MGELEDQWHFASLEQVFIDERIYKDKAFEDSNNMDQAVDHIDQRLEPWKPKFRRAITREDILKLMEIRMGRILKFNTEKADELIKGIEDSMAEVLANLQNLIPYTIAWYEHLKTKYAKGRERKTEIRSFENIEAAKVIVANEKLISFFGILGLLIVFEFVNLLLHPWLSSFTHESPVLMLLA